MKTDADEDSSVKGDSQSSTETDSGVSEGCSDNGMSTEEEDFDNARGGADPVGLASKIENLEESEDMLTNGITDNMKVCETLKNSWIRLSLRCVMTQTEALIILAYLTKNNSIIIIIIYYYCFIMHMSVAANPCCTQQLT